MSEPSPPPSSSAASPAPGPPRPPGVRRRWGRRLLALAIGAGGSLLAIELGARLLWSRLAPPIPGADDPVRQIFDPLSRGEPLGATLRREALASPTAYLQARGAGPTDQCLSRDRNQVPCLRPRTEVTLPAGDGTDRRFLIRVDRNGLRGPDRDPPPPGTLRVLALGDSMTFGMGVDDVDTWAAYLEPSLAAALARPVRVWNGGITALGPREELERLRALLPVLEPDLVVLQLTVANDPVDALRWRDGVLPLEPDPEAAAALEESFWLTNPLARWSRAYRWLAWNVGRHAVRYRLMARPEVLDRTARLVRDMRDLVSPRPFAVLIAPTVGQAQGTLSDRLVGTEAINRGLIERMAAAGIPCLDPLPRLRAGVQAGEQLYLPVDRHWSPAGNRVVAEELVPFLRGTLEGE